MTTKALSVFISIWMGFAIVGGLIDGALLGGFSEGSGDDCSAHTGDALTVCQAMQVQTSSEGGNVVSNTIGRVVRWFSAGLNYLKGWANMLALNFSFFTGDFVVVGWIVRMIIAGPMIAMLLIQRFGGG